MPEQKSEAIQSRFEFSEGILLAIATAFFYSIAYAYRAGYSLYFGLPTLFQTPSLGAVLEAAAVVGVAVISIVTAFNILFGVMPRPETAKRVATRKVYAVAAVLIGYCLLAQRGILVWVLVAFIVGTVASMELLFPFLLRQRRREYESKLLGDESSSTEAKRETVTGLLSKAIGIDIVLWGALFGGIVAMAFALGLDGASRQKSFFVAPDKANFVVVAMDSDVIAFAEFDPATRLLTRNIEIQRPSDNLTLKLRRSEIGTLGRPSASN